MNRILVNTWLKKDDQIAAIMAEEFEMSNKWKAEGIIEHLFAKDNSEGAVVIFKESDIEKVKRLMSLLPLYPFFEKN